MVVTSTYAKNARRRVAQHLVKQAGYSSKTASEFYKKGNDILTYVYLKRIRGITQLHIGIIPLYIPDSPSVMHGIGVSTMLPNSILLEDASMHQAEVWANRIIDYLNSGILAFMESISSPQALLDYLNSRSAADQRFVKSQLQVDQLTIYSSAYLGDVTFAVEYAMAAQQKIQEERIDSLDKKVARFDEAIAELRGCSAKSSGDKKKYYEAQISQYEKERQLAIFDARENAPRMIKQYCEWIKPMIASDFNGDEYFLQIVEQNKACLKYAKLFSS